MPMLQVLDGLPPIRSVLFTALIRLELPGTPGQIAKITKRGAISK